MLRLIFASIVLIHGLIHLIGFTNLLNLKRFSQFTGITLFPLSENLSKIFGIVWLFVSLVFLLSAVIFFLNKDLWWIPSITAVLISQFLIIIYWKDAWAGTIPNVIILVVTIAACATSVFNNEIHDEVTAMFSKSVKNEKEIVTKEMITKLPPVIQKWMEHSGIIGKEIIHSVRLKQKVQMRLKSDAKWIDGKAVQYFRVDEPAFIYKLDVSAIPLISMIGRDRYDNGKGNMLIKVGGLYTIADSKGEEIDKSTMVRYLSETIWFPSAAINKYIVWEQIDDSTAKAKMVFSGLSESMIVTFTPEYDVKKIEAERYGEFGGVTSLEKWLVIITGYKEFNGMRIGNAAEVTWKLKSGDFTWFKLEITNIEYNNTFDVSEFLKN